MTAPRWGFCPGCERWLLSPAWGDPAGGTPRCPRCGTPPDPLEHVQDGRGRLELVLELPPGTELPLLG